MIFPSSDGHYRLCYFRNRLHNRRCLNSGLDLDAAKLQLVLVLKQDALCLRVKFFKLLRRILASELLKDLLSACCGPLSSAE